MSRNVLTGVHNWRTALKEAAWVFGLSRLLIITITCLCVFLLPQFIPAYAHRLLLDPGYTSFPGNINILFYSWLRWDVKPFLNISFFGYQLTADTAFFPFWPLVQHFGGLLLGGSFPNSFYLAGLLLANIFFYFVLVLLYCLLTEDFDPATARKALYCLAFSPHAIFFFAGYSESLFVLLCIAFFLLLRRGKPLDWWSAGVLGFFAVLTRSSGIALLLPYLVMYFFHYWKPAKRNDSSWLQKLNALAPIALIPAAVVVYMIYLYLIKGNPLIFSVQEGAIWRRQFTLPWNTFILAIQAISLPPPIRFQNILDLTLLLIFLSTLALGWKRLPWHYRLFALGLVLFSLCLPAHTIEPLESQPRFMLSIFPITVIFALWSKKPRFYRVYMALSLLLFVMNIIFFVGDIWIA